MRLAVPLALLLGLTTAPRQGCGNGSTPPAHDSCADKVCGTPCGWPDPPCLHADPPCLPPVGPGYCDASGACAQGYPPPPDACPLLPPSWGCVRKACGDGCGYCPPDVDPASCPVPTFAPTACDARLQCVSAVTVTCSPEAACQGKKCGAACETCPSCMRPAAMYCDASGACAPGLPFCPP